MTSPSTLRQIRQSIDIRHILPAKWEVRGKVATANCIFHDEKTGSFKANLPGHQHAGRFRCHGCGESGDVFDILVELDQIPMHEAVSRLAAIAGVELEGYAPETDAERRARLLAAEERDVAAWWFRERWKLFRAQLDREMQNGPPEIGSERGAAFAGEMMRWIEINHRSDAGVKAFRVSGGLRRYLGEYRRSVQRLERRKARQMDFISWLMQFPLDGKSSSGL